MPNRTYGRALRDGLAVAGLLFAGYLFLVVAPVQGTVGFDAFAYWSVDPADAYRLGVGRLGAFTYTPVAALAFAPVHALPWWQFLWLWEALLVGTLVWLGRRRSLLLLAFPPVALELYHGNVHLLLAAAIVLGWRHPWAWAFVLLTKVTPGVGLVWFAVRREWRSLGIALGVGAALVGCSLVAQATLGVDLWGAWWRSVSATAAGASLGQVSIEVPLALRLPAAALLVAWGARTDRRWTVPVGATLALPVLWLSGLSVLVALVALVAVGTGGTVGTALGPGGRRDPSRGEP